ncbi:MAG: hypothetical protein NXI31_12110 [bacterium]|nr:hypothetical protein [bacterium]
MPEDFDAEETAAAPAGPEGLPPGSGTAPVGLRVALLAGVSSALAALVVFGLSLGWHPRLGTGGESDNYVGIAEDLLRGHVPYDAFHPYTFPLLVAAVAVVLPSAFVAGKLVSALAFGALVFAIQMLLRRYVPAWLAFTAALAIAVGPGMWLEGMRVATDMFGAALVVGAYGLVLGLPSSGRRVPGEPVVSGGSGWRLVAIGICVGLATTSRFNLGMHVPLLLLATFVHTRRLGAALRVALGCGLAMVPHLAVRFAAFGKLFGNDNWKNVVLKYEFDRDMAALRQHDDEELVAMMREGWPEWVVQGLGDFGGWLLESLPRLQLDKESASTPLVGVVLGLLIAGVLVLTLRRWRDGSPWLLIAGLGQAAFVNVMFYPEPRILLVTTVLVATVAIAGLAVLSSRFGHWLALGLVAVIGVQHLVGIPASWRRFELGHGDEEVAAARKILAEHGPLQQIACTYPFLEREVECAGTSIIMSLGMGQENRAADLWRRLDLVREKRPVSWFVLGSGTGYELHRLARSAELPPGWTRERSDEEIVVLHRASERGLALAVEPTSWAEGELVLRLTMPATTAADPVWVGVELRGPGGANHRLQTPAATDAWELRLQRGALAPGRWLAIPTTLASDRKIDQGAPVEFVVE